MKVGYIEKHLTVILSVIYTTVIWNQIGTNDV